MIHQKYQNIRKHFEFKELKKLRSAHDLILIVDMNISNNCNQIKSRIETLHFPLELSVWAITLIS